MSTEGGTRRLRVGILFGGRSGEHDVSLRSAQSVMAALDPARYDVVPIGIGRDGSWVIDGDPMRALTDGSNVSSRATAILTNASQHGLVTIPVSTGESAIDAQSPNTIAAAIDVVFPVMHGPYGEDGTIQGLLEIADVAYVGSGVLGSAVGMDKSIQKTLLRAAGIPVIDWISFTANEWSRQQDRILVDVEVKLAYPCFVKPSNLGSSVGISKASNESELITGVELAASFDRRIVIEKSVLGFREIECSVLGNDSPDVSVPGEIVPDREWYDYDAKYSNSKTELIIPAQIPLETAREVRRLAAAAFAVLDCAGMARVDFFVSQDGSNVFVNEVNTIPGFTNISMFPKLWEATGMSYAALIDRLIELAIERHRERSTMRTTQK